LKPVLKPGHWYFKAKFNFIIKKEIPVKNKLALLAVSAQKVNPQNIRFFLTIIALCLFVLGVGAPVDSDGGPK
jgi:hypothetical protein